jgi:hypothetical protein
MAKKKKNKKRSIIDVVKAARKGSREAQIETSTGFIAVDKTFKSKKTYTRKKKHKNKDNGL